MLNAIDRERVAAAVAAAEAETRGEIVCVVTGEVSQYREAPLAWAAAAGLVLPPLALALGLRPLDLAGAAGLWLAEQGGALERNLAVILGLYALAQAALFVGVFLLVHIPAVRRALTPASLKRHRVEAAAQHHFASVSALAKGSHTGVLIFVAPVDRQVRILADAALHEKADEDAWRRAADAVGGAMKAGADPTSGILEAIAICGAQLKAHFPASSVAPR